VGGANYGDHGGGPNVIAPRGHLLLASAGGLVAAAAASPARGLLVQSREAPLHHPLPRRHFTGPGVVVLFGDNLMHPVLAQRGHVGAAVAVEDAEEVVLAGSISLSPLYSSLTIDLHVKTAAGLHQSFLWLHLAQA